MDGRSDKRTMRVKKKHKAHVVAMADESRRLHDWAKKTNDHIMVKNDDVLERMVLLETLVMDRLRLKRKFCRNQMTQKRAER